MAVKVLLTEARSDYARRRFEVEVRAMLRLRHPGVVALLDAGEHQGTPYLVMEWIEGQTLEAQLRRGGPLPPDEAAALVRTVALSLAHCHERGVLHRDLKPSNVMFRGDGAPVLTDFGLSREVDRAPRGAALTRTGQFMGTPGFWAPEQARGDQAAIGPQTDVYGLGALLYFALTGACPNRGQTLIELLELVRLDPPPPSSRQAGIPPALDAICGRALARAPAERFASARELAQALTDWAGPGHPSARRGAWLVLVGALAVTGGGVALGHLSRAGPASPPGAAAVPLPLPLPLPAASAEGTDPNATLVAELEGLLEAGALDRAHELLAGPGVDPGAPGVLGCSALLAAQEGALARARELAERALRGQPGSWTARQARVLIAADGPDWPYAALEDLRFLVEARPQSEALWLLLAHARHARGDLIGARQAFDRAVLVDGAREAWTQRGVFRLDAGELDGGLLDLDRALELEPSSPAALRERGRGRMLTGDLSGALQDLALALEVAPRDPHAQLYTTVLPSVLRVGGTAEVALRARELLSRDLPAPALRLIERTLEGAPDQPPLLLLRAEALAALGELERVLEPLAQVLAADPRAGRAYALRARVRIARGEDPEPDLREATLCGPEDALVLATRGRVLLRRGEARPALELFERAARGSPLDGELLAGCAQARLALGDLERALEDVLTASTLRSGSSEVWTITAQVRLGAGQLGRALGAAELALALAPEDAAAQRTLGQVLLERGELGPAIARLEQARARGDPQAAALLERARRGVSQR